MKSKTINILIVSLVLISVIILGISFWTTGNRGGVSELESKEEFIIYKRTAARYEKIGYNVERCSTEDINDCRKLIEIYNTGKVVVDDKETVIDKNNLALLERVIVETDIRNKECEAQRVFDYFKDYNIYLKEVTYPGCKEELDKIDEVVIGTILQE